MARVRVVVTYEDGKVAEFNPRKPRLLLNFEEKYGTVEAVEESAASMIRLAHMALGGKTGFDTWVDKIDDIELVQDEETPKADPS